MALESQWWTVELTEEEMRVAAHMGCDRQAYAAVHRLSHRFNAPKEGPWSIGVNGALGEFAVAKRTGRYPVGLGSLGDFHSCDVAGGIEVRTTIDYKQYGLRWNEKDKNKGGAPFVCVSTVPQRQNVFVLHGWIPGSECRNQEWFNASWGAYNVPVSALRPMRGLEDYISEREYELSDVAELRAQ